MYKRLFTTLAIFLGLLGMTHLHAQEEASQKPEVVGLYFHAKWCSSCKKIDSRLDEALASKERPNFKLITLNLDNKATQHASESVAETVGLLDLYKKTGVKTGFILLVDTSTNKVIDKITRHDESEDMIEKLDASLGAAQS